LTLDYQGDIVFLEGVPVQASILLQVTHEPQKSPPEDSS
jgi:hypothetical protein